ncbi:2-phosphosulfolactate phosphatase [Nisaea sediminum]|uniref:2-phosphosulfolactate phosphatase n=1 Tax=Nisaea sediminum TaxID=2775867 RepID=UPI0018670E2B|nr:2-phosphosulfolactate phosphatase [Nisaea sediminum]
MTEIRLEWGEAGVAKLCHWANAVVIVDVLSFSTCVSIAADREIQILPFEHDYEEAAAFAVSKEAIVAKRRRDATNNDVSLSPASFTRASPGTRYVLPSPNGATLSRLASDREVFAGCLRNARAVGKALSKFHKVAVIPAGERWNDNSLRPAIEDWLGAGAIVDAMSGARAPEAEIAVRSFRSANGELALLIGESESGRELAGSGYAEDVTYAAELNVSGRVPKLKNGVYSAV